MAVREYEVRVRGRLAPATADALRSLRWTIDEYEEENASILRGSVRDQSELHGLLDSLAESSIELLEIRPSDPRAGK